MHIQGRLLATVYVGHPVPGTGGREAFMGIAGQSLVFHGHTNPRLALGEPVQALIDGRVLPGALGIASIREIFLQGPAGGPKMRLERVRDSALSPPTGGASYSWWLHRGGDRRECVSSSVGAYVAYLQQLRFQALYEPRAFEAATEPGRIVLHDEPGRTDTLDVGAETEARSVWLKLRSTGHVATIPRPQADLLFPTEAALLQELPQPTPYQQVGELAAAASR